MHLHKPEHIEALSASSAYNGTRPTYSMTPAEHKLAQDFYTFMHSTTGELYDRHATAMRERPRARTTIHILSMMTSSLQEEATHLDHVTNDPGASLCRDDHELLCHPG